MIEEIDVISDRTLPRVIAAMLFQQGVTADEFYPMARSGTSYNKVWILEALRALEHARPEHQTHLAAEYLRGADQIQSVLGKAHLLVDRFRSRAGRHGRHG